MGFDMIQGDHEDAPGQLELNWMYDDVLRNADRLSTYRQICAQVAREFNLIACFMTKPFMGVSASGCHTNMSLWTGGKDKVNKLVINLLPAMDEVFTYVEGGTNTLCLILKMFSYQVRLVKSNWWCNETLRCINCNWIFNCKLL